MTAVLLVGLPATRLAYLVLFLLIGGESAGIPLPGETALITAGILASQEKLDIALVVVIAAAAAIIGDNFGYLLGRKGARRLLQRPGRLEERRRDLLRRGEAYFARHGGKTVFFGRWLPVLRITAAWLAGAHHMPWPKFLAWNALGGIAWAISIGLLAYLAGHTAEAVLHDASYVALGGLVVILVAVSSWALWRRRLAS
jgi:membrane protein DedA with SNARE-associated domain